MWKRIEWFHDDELFLSAIIIFVTNLLLRNRASGERDRASEEQEIDSLNHDWIIFSSVISERSFIKPFLIFLIPLAKRNHHRSRYHMKKAYDCLSYAESGERKRKEHKKRLMVMRMKCFSFLYYFWTCLRLERLPSSFAASSLQEFSLLKLKRRLSENQNDEIF